MPLITLPRRSRFASWPLIAIAAVIGLVVMVVAVHMVARSGVL